MSAYETGHLLQLALAGFDPRRLKAILARGPTAALLARPADHADLLAPRVVEGLLSGRAAEAARRETELAARHAVRVVGFGEPDYPEHLAQIFDPPPVLWVRGRLSRDEGTRAVAVVGARAATRDGAALARQLGCELAAAGATVVSGLARGIDTAVHQGTLDAGGRGVAVVGSGLLRLYPAENEALAEALVAGGGALVSELPLRTEARPGHFPRRNRILAGWSAAVVVVEAGERSGALITVRSALDEGREVLAVPGHPASENAAGTNRLIRDGARLVRHATDVLEELGIAAPAAVPAAPTGLLAALEPGVPRRLDELETRTGRRPAALLAELGLLELERRVRRLPGGAFVRA